MARMAEFIESTWSMVNAHHPEIGWSDDGTLIVVSNAERLAERLLPQYFRHGQYASWVRALNAYDFKKSGAGRWHHPSFVRGHPELLGNIRRKVPPSRSNAGRAGGASGHSGAGPSGALSTSTALVPQHKRAPTSPDLGMRQQYFWMQQELARLEREAGALQAEEFQQRFDTVRLMQVMLSQITNGKSQGGAGTTGPRITLNPAVLAGQGPGGVSGAAGHSALTYRGGDAASSRKEAEEEPVIGDAMMGDGGALVWLPQVHRDRSDGGDSLPSLPTVHSSQPSFDIANLDLDLVETVHTTSGGGGSGGDSSSGDSGGGGSGGVLLGGVVHSPPAVEEASTSPPAHLPLFMSDSATVLQLEDDAVKAPMDDGMERVDTSGGAFPQPVRSVAGEHSRQALMSAAPVGSNAAIAANAIMGALATTAASNTALQFATVLSRMPPLPASTRELPPRGTVQREHIEAAIELAFRQLTLTANQALASQQAAGS